MLDDYTPLSRQAEILDDPEAYAEAIRIIEQDPTMRLSLLLTELEEVIDVLLVKQHEGNLEQNEINLILGCFDTVKGLFDKYYTLNTSVKEQMQDESELSKKVRIIKERWNYTKDK